VDGFVRRTVAAIGLATLAVASAVLVWRGVDVLLLVFAGVLLALFLRGLAGRTARLTGLPDGAAVAVVVVVLAALTGVGGWLIAPAPRRAGCGARPRGNLARPLARRRPEAATGCRSIDMMTPAAGSRAPRCRSSRGLWGNIWLLALAPSLQRYR
jgi:hypothetical protein